MTEWVAPPAREASQSAVPEASGVPEASAAPAVPAETPTVPAAASAGAIVTELLGRARGAASEPRGQGRSAAREPRTQGRSSARSSSDASKGSSGRAAEPAAADAEHSASAPAHTPPADPARAAYDDGVRLLARRARSSGELREELLRLDHAAGDVDVVIDEFRESHYLDDIGLARTVTEKLRTSKKSSRAQIRIKLRDRRLPDNVIEAALGELDQEEEHDLLREAAHARAAKLGGLERHVAERRLLGFLARRGWSGQAATQAAKDALDGNGSGRSGGGVRFH